VKAAFPFAARNADELNLDEGDVIKVLRQEDEHWWVGEMRDGRQGYFPASYTTMIGKTFYSKVDLASSVRRGGGFPEGVALLGSLLKAPSPGNYFEI
jgi:jouberin